MTERWRKKLGDLDATGPGDDVFTRAHDGPQQPDPQIELPKTSTKVVTGVAAFVVFALAISVFAIPALRMRNGGPASPGPMQLPLWPARSLDDLEALQQRAGAGEADAVWALDPRQLAERFGREVLGWDAMAVVDMTGIVTDCTGNDSCPINAVEGPSGYPATTATAYPGVPSTSAPVPRVISFVLSYDALCNARLCPRSVSVELYQPLGSGEGSVWAIRTVHGETTRMGAAGGLLRDGDSIYVGTRLVGDEIPTLAYHIGPGSCDDVDYATSEWTEVRSTETDDRGVGLTLRVEHGCAEPTPGYVLLATAAGSLIANDESGHLADPFVEGGTMLTSLTAVPVTFLPPVSSGTGAPPTAEPTVMISEPGMWIPYASDSDYGWTIERPQAGEPSRVDDGVTFPIGDGLFVTILRISGVAPGDDSSFPLDPDTLDGSFSGYTVDFTFRGDGQAFEFFVSSEAGGQLVLSDDQRATVEQMLRSIRFEPWNSGDVRNGWAPIPPFPTSAEWVNLGRGVYVVFREESNEGFRVFGPIESCGEGQNMDLTQGGTVAVQECPDGSSVEYTYDDGGGKPERLVIVAHDGSRLVQLP